MSGKETIVVFIFLALLMFSKMSHDSKTQCDGKTKTFASMGRVYQCDNYRGVK